MFLVSFNRPLTDRPASWRMPTPKQTESWLRSRWRATLRRRTRVGPDAPAEAPDTGLRRSGHRPEVSPSRAENASRMEVAKIPLAVLRRRRASRCGTRIRRDPEGPTPSASTGGRRSWNETSGKGCWTDHLPASGTGGHRRRRKLVVVDGTSPGLPSKTPGCPGGARRHHPEPLAGGVAAWSLKRLSR